MGHVLGAEKGNFLIRGAEADDATGRPRWFNPVNPCPRGLPGVVFGSVVDVRNRLRRMRRRFQHISANSLITPAHKTMNSLAKMASTALGCHIDGVCGTGDYPQLDLPRETSRSRSTSEKSK